MREKLELPEYEAPEPPEKLTASTSLGALAAEQTLLESEHQLESHRQDAEFLDAYSVRNRFHTRAPRKRAVQAWSQGKYGAHSSIEMSRTLAHNSVKGAEQDVRQDESNLRHYIDSVRKNIARYDEYESDKLSKGVESTLDEYAERHNLDPNKLAFRQWKKQAEIETGQPMSWTAWITRPSRSKDGTLTKEDRQVLNFLHFNQAVFEERNNDPKTVERLEALQASYEQGLSLAVKNGELSPKLLDAYKANPTKIIIGEPLDEVLLQANGYISSSDTIILDPKFNDGTFVHEQSHLLGHFGDFFLNEGMTQMVADVIDHNRGAEVHNTGYKANVTSMQNIMLASRIGIYDMSVAFNGNKVDAFFGHVRRMTGQDVYGSYKKLVTYARQKHRDQYDRDEQVRSDMLKYTNMLLEQSNARGQS